MYAPNPCEAEHRNGQNERTDEWDKMTERHDREAYRERTGLDQSLTQRAERARNAASRAPEIPRHLYAS